MSRKLLATCIGAAALSLFVGCTASSPFGTRPSTAADQGVATGYGYGATSPTANAGSTKLKSMGDKISDALTIKPKVVSADDPVKLNSQPKDVPASLYTQAAWYAERQGNTTAAVSQYEKALERDPRDVTTLISYARFLDRSGKSDDALRIYQRAQSVASNYAPLWNDLGLFYARRSDSQRAMEALNQAVALQPNNLRYRNNLAAVLVETQRPQDAVQQLERLQPPAIARHNVGYLLYLQHKPEAAAEYFSQALRLDPSLTQAQQMLSQLRAPVDAMPVGASPAPSASANATRERQPLGRVAQITPRLDRGVVPTGDGRLPVAEGPRRLPNAD